MSSSIYALLVRENGRLAEYYCLLTPDDTSACNWTLIRENRVLSMGACATADISNMLEALREDLGTSEGSGSWTSITIH